MPASRVLRRMALVWTAFSYERNASIINETRISELGTTLAVTSNRRRLRKNIMWERKRYYGIWILTILVTLMIESLRSSETSFLTRANLRNISEDSILHFFNLLQICFSSQILYPSTIAV
jgi:hypothetical protein